MDGVSEENTSSSPGKQPLFRKSDRRQPRAIGSSAVVATVMGNDYDDLLDARVLLGQRPMVSGKRVPVPTASMGVRDALDGAGQFTRFEEHPDGVLPISG